MTNLSLSTETFYSIYQITNKVNGKIYVGAHKTFDLNDAYMSSSQLVANAIKKYGLENFIKETIHLLNNDHEMFDKEAEIVNEDFIKRFDTYNVTLGGRGGFYHINNDPIKRAEVTKASINANKGVSRFNITQNGRDAISKNNKENIKKCIGPYSKKSKAKAKRKNKSLKKRKQLREIMKGETNGMFGSAIYINLITKEKKRFLKDDVILDGWIKSIDYEQNRMLTNWYNDGAKNYRIKKDDPIITTNLLIRGRVK